MELNRSTKEKGDLAEQAAILAAMKKGWGVSTTIGDRLPYDIIFDVEGKLAKIQIKSSWFDKSSGNYKIDSRRTKTNRRVMKRSLYKSGDFDFALIYIEDHDLFYVLPFNAFAEYKSDIYLIVTDDRQRKARSCEFKDAWDLISAWASMEEIS